MPLSAPSADWRDVVSRLLKSEMSKRKLKYEELSQLLEAQGTSQTAANLRNKINRGILGADLFVQILFVLNVQHLNKDVLSDIIKNINS